MTEPTPVDAAITAARDLADRTETGTRRVGWAGPRLERDTARGQHLNPDDRTDRNDATATLDALPRPL